MRWLLLWAAAIVPTALIVGRILAGSQPGLTNEGYRRENGPMATSATTDHRGHGCPDDPTWDPETQTFRTPQVIRLEIALAKAHYFEACTIEEANARHDRLVALETELDTLVGSGCES